MRARTTRVASKVLMVGAISAFALLTTPLFAARKGEAEADQKIQAMTVQLAELQVQDQLNAATSERGKAQALLDKARAIIGERRERDELDRTLQEADATIAYAGGLVVESKKQQELNAAKQKLETTENQIEQVRSEVAKLEKEQAKLDKKLGGAQ